MCGFNGKMNDNDVRGLGNRLIYQNEQLNFAPLRRLRIDGFEIIHVPSLNQRINGRLLGITSIYSQEAIDKQVRQSPNV